MTPLKVFIVDTNVVVAGLISTQEESSTAKIVDAMLSGRLIFALSMDLLQEYRDVLMRPKLVHLHGLSQEQIDQILTEMTANAIWHETVVEAKSAAPDPGDNHLWRLLASEVGSILVTGDRLLYENPPRKNSVISPATCVKVFMQKVDS